MAPLAALLLLARGVAAGTSTLCFTVVPPGEQAKLLAQQFYEGVGIFACDHHMIFSSSPAEELFQPQQWDIKQWPTAGPKIYLVPPWQGEPGAGTMRKVWDQIFQLGLYEQCAWTLKMDPEVAFLATRTRDVLRPHCSKLGCQAAFLTRGGQIPGPMHALTSAAVELFKQNAGDCPEVLGETAELYLKKCLEQSQVKALQENGLFADFSTASVAVLCNSSTGSFYPFRQWGQYMSCLGQAGYSLIPDSPNNLAKVSWTRDVLMGGGYYKPSIYCWALVQHLGQEPELLRWQRERGLGIFACDGWMVVSNVSAREVLHGEAWHTNVTIVNEPTTVEKSFISQNGKLIPVLPNAGVFSQAWRAVFQKGDFRQFDWTLKLDIEVALAPERLRKVLKSHCSAGCGKKLLQTFGGDLEGPVEALSHDAAESLASGMASCTQGAGYLKQPENQWLSHCASTLGVEADRAPLLLSSHHQETPRPCDTMHGSFYPFPLAKDMEWCLKQSGYYYIEAPETTTRTSSTTRTSTSSTTVTRTSSTATTSTATTTVPKLAKDSIFHDLEGRDVQKQLPVWVITAENDHRGIPFAIEVVGGFLLVTSLSIYGLCCRRSTGPAAAVATPTSRAREDMEELLRGP